MRGILRKPNKDFELFKKEFKKWQNKFGLDGYRVYFKYEPTESSFASIVKNQGQMVATVSLNSSLSAKDKPFKDIKRDAKHEALHLLVSRLGEAGKFRYSTETELYEAEEELVNRLASLIP